MALRPRAAWFVPLLSAMLATVAVLAGCGEKARLPALAPDAVLVAFGDSLTFGIGANESESYPAQLARLVGRRVVREGIPGEVSAAGLARLPGVLDEHRPRVLLLCHGGNDFLQRLPKAAAADNLRAMIRMAKARGIEVVLFGTPELSLSVTPPAFYGEIAKEFRIPYEADVIGKILRDPSLKSDQIHPNAAGYRLMAERVAELLRKSGAL